MTNAEDLLPYAIPISVGLAGFNWASLFPGNNNPVLVAAAFGFLAKFLYGLQQTLSTDPRPKWTTILEDLIPSVVVGLGVGATAVSANPDYLAYTTAIGFITKALGYLATRGNPTEDLLLALGAILVAYGTDVGKPEIVGAGSLISLVGKTIPSLGGTQTIAARPPKLSSHAPA